MLTYFLTSFPIIWNNSGLCTRSFLNQLLMKQWCFVTDNCFSFQFECRNKKWIPSVYTCDLDDDCGDNSDESDCVGFRGTYHTLMHQVSFQIDLNTCMNFQCLHCRNRTGHFNYTQFLTFIIHVGILDKTRCIYCMDTCLCINYVFK